MRTDHSVMNDRAIAGSTNESANPGRPRTFNTIIYGGLVVGVLDISEAFAFYGIRSGVTPTRVLHSVAGGLLGRASFSGGLKTALLGLLLHFLIAFILATIYYLASSIPPFAYPECGSGGTYLWCGSLFRDDLRRGATISGRASQRSRSVAGFRKWRDWTRSARRFADCPHREAVGQS